MTPNERIINRDQIKKLNQLIAGTEYEALPIEGIVAQSRMTSEDAYLFNVASSIYNHSFMFLTIYPGGKAPTPWMQAWLKTHFGGEKRFKDFWKVGSKTLFGSGWCWLVLYDGQPMIVPAMVESNPVGRDNLFPICVMDLWEHAYIKDYGNNKNAYIDNWLDSINWEFIETAIKRIPMTKQITPHFETNFQRQDHRLDPDNDDLEISPVNPYFLEKLASAEPNDIPSPFVSQFSRIENMKVEEEDETKEKSEGTDDPDKEEKSERSEEEEEEELDTIIEEPEEE